MVNGNLRIGLILSPAEAEALGAMAVRDCRDARRQAHYLLRQALEDFTGTKLIDQAPPSPPKTVPEPATSACAT